MPINLFGTDKKLGADQNGFFVQQKSQNPKKPRKSPAGTKSRRRSERPRNSGSNRNYSPLGAIFVKYIIIIFCFFFVFSFFFFFFSLKFEKGQPFWDKKDSRFGKKKVKKNKIKGQPFWGVTQIISLT